MLFATGRTTTSETSGWRHLIGRRAELTFFEENLSDQSAQIIEVAGDPGIGKTSLLEAFAVTADRLGFRSRTGTATRSDDSMPFGVFVDALDDSLRGDIHAEDLLSPRQFDPVLGTVFPAVLERSGGTTPAEITPRGTQRAIRDLLEQIGRRGRFVLLLDDVHLADPASIELLIGLAGKPPRHRVTLVLSYRHRQLPAGLAAALAKAQRGGRSRRLHLGPLSRSEAAVLVGPAIGPGRLSTAYQLANGNPLYLEALAEPATDTPLPSTVCVATLAEIATLSPSALLVARAAAVAGQPFQPTVAAVAADSDETSVLSALDELQAHDLIRPTGAARSFEFRHPLVRDAIYQNIPVGWRLAAHGRIAARLESRHAPHPLRAPHVLAVAGIGDNAAFDLLVSAADSVCAQDPANAATWYAGARDLLPHATDPRRFGVLRRLASALGVSGRYDDAREVLRDALRTASHRDNERPAAVGWYAAQDRFLGHYDAARRALEKELAEFPEDTGLLLEMASLNLAQGRYDVARRQARLCRERAPERSSQSVRAVALLALSNAMTGDLSSACEHFTAADAALATLSDRELVQNLELFVTLGNCSIAMEHNHEAAAGLQRGLSLARQSGHDYVRPPLLIALSEAHLRLGNLEFAEAHAQEALEAALAQGTGKYRMLAVAQQSTIATATGDLATAMNLGEQAAGLAQQFTGEAALTAVRALAAAWLMAGRTDAGTSLLLETHGGDLLPSLPVPIRPYVFWMLARSSRLGDDPSGASGWAGRADATAGRLDLPTARGFAALAGAEAALGVDPRRALRRAGEARSGFRAGNERLGLAWTEHLAATAHGALGDTAEEKAAAGRAYALFVACGAQVMAENAAAIDKAATRRAVTREPGGTVPSAPDLDELSPRQRQVARLVAEGRSNREIAGVLLVVERTVEAHVSQILRRLGVGSRAAIATWVVRKTYVD